MIGGMEMRKIIFPKNITITIKDKSREAESRRIFNEVAIPIVNYFLNPFEDLFLILITQQDELTFNPS